ncbi:MAG: YihY/virulence factor BrkB family protein [Bryobacteraceae bacterium]
MPTSLWKFGGLSAKELGQRVYQRLLGDDVLNRAAALAYYFLLSIFPFLLFLTSVLGLVLGGRGELYASLMEYLETAMPQAGFVLLENIMEEVMDAAGGGKLAAGLAGALWAGSLGILAIMSGLNSAYRVEDTRPWWRARLLAIGMTVGFALFVFLGLGLLLFGGRIGTWLAEQVGLGEAFATVWRFLHWPLVLFLVLIALGLIYRFAPDLEGQRWHWITPGAAIALGLWMLASGGLRIYLNFFDNYSNVYGSLGALIILMLWFYLTGLAILVGGEVNSVIENVAAEHGEPGARRPGQKRPELQSA